MSLAERILGVLEKAPGKKAQEIAKELDLDKSEVNSCLYGKLKGKVWQDKAYKWYSKKSGSGPANSPQDAPTQKLNTPLNRLCRYYLDCMSRDEDLGVSVFAKNQFGSPDYAELQNENLFEDKNYFEQQDANRILGSFRRERKRLALYLGYPVRLRKYVSRKGWEGFFVEPIFLLPFEIDDRYGMPTLASDLPVLNFKALSWLTEGGAGNLMEEVISLSDELGLNNPQEDLPDLEEVFPRIQHLRPEWGWREAIHPEALNLGKTLAEIEEEGIYNRAVVLYGERSPYTQGLETELKKLSETAETNFTKTALGAWVNNSLNYSSPPSNSAPLLEVLPMNSEQAQAIHQALSEPLTVITGPPGTGKSQVVTNLLINAAWRGQKVLFASKNNKAVDVVETRVNGLGSRPILLRMGSNEYQAKLADYLVQLLSTTTTQADKDEYQECLAIHQRLINKTDELEKGRVRTLEARNEVDDLEQKVESLRKILGAELFAQIRQDVDLGQLESALGNYERLLANCDRNQQQWLTRLFWGMHKKSRYEILEKSETNLRTEVLQIGEHLLTTPVDDTTVSQRIGKLKSIKGRVAQVKNVHTYFEALDFLKTQPSFEDLTQKQMNLMKEVAGNSESLWQHWIKLQPGALTQQDRSVLNEYASVLKILVSSRNEGRRADKQIYRKYYELFPKVSHMLPCWAVTSLSANNKVPFEPGYFDLLVIDEASQCDIASALPLLFRAKRAVVIGDPKQLSHISSISMTQDKKLMDKHDVIDSFTSWSYSANSLFDLAIGLARPEDIVALKDHHRSHAHIIDFSNKHFYEGNLRVATRYDRLRLLNDGKPAVRWKDHPGQVVRPANGGAANNSEAQAVVEKIRDLVVERGYKGTIGVVTPFRAQANRIREIVFQDDPLSQMLLSADFLVDTVHKFQGDERDVMFFSPVVSKGVSQGSLGFLKKTGNLFNVAITRARALLYVVGDMTAASESGVDYLVSFASYAHQLTLQKDTHSEAVDVDLGPEYPNVSNPAQVSDWERLFYKALYAAGVRTIPQYSVEQYALDFAVFDGSRKLNLEVDGERYHRSWTGELCRRDQLRNQRMIELGWEVKRFWIYQIRDELDECVDWVRHWLDGVAPDRSQSNES